MDNQANAGADLDKLEAFSDAELNEMEAVACAAPAIWYGTYQIIDGISDEKAVELIEACSPDAIRTLIAQARRALPRVTEQAIPMGAISKTLADAMAVAIENGANSISMPDEYVAVAHFVAYPEQYRTRQAAPEAPTEPEHGLYVAYGDDAAVDLFANAMKAKMAASRAKGRSGWHAPEDCPTERLQGMLIEHLAKGDPVDIGNFAMMLWNRGERVAAPEAPAWDVIALAVDEAEKNGLNYVTTDLLRKLLVRTRAAPATQQAGAGDERPACDMPPDVHQNCGSPNCAMRDYGPGDACKRRATPAATTASATCPCPCPNVDLQNHDDGTASCVGTCPSEATTASDPIPHHYACPQRGHNPLCAGCEAECKATRASASGERNQCDGCAQGLGMNDWGNHVDAAGRPFMSCTKGRYHAAMSAATNLEPK
jgi:hypothetical protein